VLCLACRAADERATADTASTVPRAVSSAVAVGDTSCPEYGEWRACSVLERLEDAGLVVQQEPNPVQLPFMHVPGILFTTTLSSIHAFLYADEGARRRDTEQLDSARVAPRNGTYTWPEPAWLVTSNNLAAIVVSPNERQAERIVLALSAGLPKRR
jgi:hypothetical protein